MNVTHRMMYGWWRAHTQQSVIGPKRVNNCYRLTLHTVHTVYPMLMVRSCGRSHAYDGRARPFDPTSLEIFAQLYSR